MLKSSLLMVQLRSGPEQGNIPRMFLISGSDGGLNESSCADCTSGSEKLLYTSLHTDQSNLEMKPTAYLLNQVRLRDITQD